MITIDGSLGEGGGQILRTALALSLVTAQPFRITNIRARRSKPGLMRQHLTAVNAAAEIGHAKVEGNTIGSKTFTFMPGNITAGNYHFAVGTAGSCTLVLQTILPALIMADGPSDVILEGGTHNPFAPPFDFLKQSFLAVLKTMGPRVAAELQRPGFYPAGGGRFSVSIQPAPLKPVTIRERGDVLRMEAKAIVANLPLDIARRELRVVCKKLEWSEDCLKAVEAKGTDGPGNILTITVESENITEVFTGFGERGVSAEKVAHKAVNQVREYLAADVPVGRYLADQILVLMALAGGGSYLTLSPSQHTNTNIEIVKTFLNVRIDPREIGPNRWEVVVR